MPKIEEVITVFVDGRHDFRRRARVLDVRGNELLVRYVDYALPDELIPARWL